MADQNDDLDLLSMIDEGPSSPPPQDDGGELDLFALADEVKAKEEEEYQALASQERALGDSMARKSIAETFDQGEVTTGQATKSTGLAAQEYFKDDHGFLSKAFYALSIPEQAVTRNVVNVLENFDALNPEEAKALLSRDELHGSDLVNFYWKTPRTVAGRAGRFAVGLLTDIVLDPLSYVGVGALTKIGKTAIVGGKTMKNLDKVSKAERIFYRTAEKIDKIIDAEGKLVSGAKGAADDAANRLALAQYRDKQIGFDELQAALNVGPNAKKAIQEAKDISAKSGWADEMASGERGITLGVSIPFTNLAKEVTIFRLPQNEFLPSMMRKILTPIGATGTLLGKVPGAEFLSRNFRGLWTKTGFNTFDAELNLYHGHAGAAQETIANWDRKTREKLGKLSQEDLIDLVDEMEFGLNEAEISRIIKKKKKAEYIRQRVKTEILDPDATDYVLAQEYDRLRLEGQISDDAIDALDQPGVQVADSFRLVSSRERKFLEPTEKDLARRARLAKRPEFQEMIDDVRQMNLGLVEELEKRGIPFSELNPFGEGWARGYVKHLVSRDWLDSMSKVDEAERIMRDFIEEYGSKTGKIDRSAGGRKYRGGITEMNAATLEKYGVKMFVDDPVELVATRMREMEQLIRNHDLMQAAADSAFLVGNKRKLTKVADDVLDEVVEELEGEIIQYGAKGARAAGDDIVGISGAERGLLDEPPLRQLPAGSSDQATRVTAEPVGEIIVRDGPGPIDPAGNVRDVNQINEVALRGEAKADRFTFDKPIGEAAGAADEAADAAGKKIKVPKKPAQRTKIPPGYVKFNIDEWKRYMLTMGNEVDDKIVAFLPDVYKTKGLDVYLPDTVMDRMNYVLNREPQKSGLAKLMSGFDFFNRVWRNAALFGPGYIGLNAMSNALTFFGTSAVRNPFSSLWDASSLLISRGDDLHIFRDHMGKKYALTAQELWEKALENNVLRSNVASEYSFEHIAEHVASNRQARKSLGQKAVTLADHAMLWSLNRSVAQYADDIPKLAVFIDRLKQGFSYEGAAEAAERYFYNFNNVSSQMNTVRQALPFSTFPLKTAEMVMETIKRGELGRLTLPAKVNNVLEGAFVEDQDTRQAMNKMLGGGLFNGQRVGFDPIHGQVIPGGKETLMEMPWTTSTLSFVFNPEGNLHPLAQVALWAVGRDERDQSSLISGKAFKQGFSKNLGMLVPIYLREPLAIMEINGEIDAGGIFASAYESSEPEESLRASYGGLSPSLQPARLQRFDNSVKAGMFLDEKLREDTITNMVYGFIFPEEVHSDPTPLNQERAATRFNYIRKRLREVTFGTTTFNQLDVNFLMNKGALDRQIRDQRQALFDEAKRAGNLLDAGKIDDPEHLRRIGETKPKAKELWALMEKREALSAYYDFVLMTEKEYPDMDVFGLLFGISDEKEYRMDREAKPETGVYYPKLNPKRNMSEALDDIFDHEIFMDLLKEQGPEEPVDPRIQQINAPEPEAPAYEHEP